MAGEDTIVNEKSETFNPSDLPELLNQYYQRLFPYKYYYKWLSYGNVPKNYFSNREFSFTLKDDIYLRYQSFSDQAEMEKEIQRKLPYKIDIGAVFSHQPKDHKTVNAGSFRAQEKELVFDIDMTDYDEVRTCCSGADICLKCWPLMTLAIRILDRSLRDDFGFQHRLWVYSGRRGVHCWVSDETARKLSQSARSAIAEYLSVIKGGENQARKVNFAGQSLHPALQKAKGLVRKYFYNHFIEDQQILDKAETWKGVTSLIPDEGLRNEIDKDWSSFNGTGQQRWDRLVARLNKGTFQKCRHLVDEIMFQYVYPRLDVNVSKGVNHLLKSPFCIHPKTGRVCTPIDVNKVEAFNPFDAPTISKLCAEIDKYDQEISNDATPDNAAKANIKDYMKTSLKPTIEVFIRFLKGLEEENTERRQTQKDRQDANGDW